MANLRELRTRIASVKSTRKITSAMKMMSAARLRQAQEATGEAGYYTASLMRIMKRLSRIILYWNEIDEAKGLKPRYEIPELAKGHESDQNHLVIVYTSSRGLCGGFNINVAKKATQFIKFLQEKGRKVQIICVGSKGAEMLRGQFGDQIVATFSSKVDTNEQHEEANKVANEIVTRFMNKEIDSASIVYNHFNSAISQEVRIRPIVPIKTSDAVSEYTGEKVYGFDVDASEGGELRISRPSSVDSRTKTMGMGVGGVAHGEKAKAAPMSLNTQQYRPKKVRDALSSEINSNITDFDPVEYDLEPNNPVDILNALLPNVLTTLVFLSSLQSSAAEHGARMTAMDNATNNAGDIIDNLTLSYNRKRQALITNELTEIISGAEAL
ncbi:MAG: F0F1 ATP synthase subunit gamma [Alphaproteobacteria bacterium]|nr:F0F1 ATP synthase subunit gamma [Alphaproteobacteria bacterium]